MVRRKVDVTVPVVLVVLLASVLLAFAGCNQPTGTDTDQSSAGSDGIHVTGVSLDCNTLDLVEGGTYQFQATVSPTDADNTNVTWSSDNDAVATVDTGGTVTGVADGQTVITVTTEDGGYSDDCSVTILAGVALDRARMHMVVADTQKLEETVYSGFSNQNDTH
jgi:uncharacterized protein YjdB